jgi:hypothetical protein
VTSCYTIFEFIMAKYDTQSYETITKRVGLVYDDPPFVRWCWEIGWVLWATRK